MNILLVQNKMGSFLKSIKNLKDAFLCNQKRKFFLLWLLFASFLQILIVLTSTDNFQTKNQTNQLVVLVSILSCGISTFIFWLRKEKFTELLKKWENKPRLKFVLLGSFGALWTEFIFWAFEKLLGGSGVAANPNLIVDWIVTMPWYLMMIILIWKIQTRYDYSLMEMAFFGGIYESFADGVLKMVFMGQIAQMILLIPILPMFVIAYSYMILPPTIIMRRVIEIANSAHLNRRSRKRFIYGWIPLLGLIPYFFFYLFSSI